MSASDAVSVAVIVPRDILQLHPASITTLRSSSAAANQALLQIREGV